MAKGINQEKLGKTYFAHFDDGEHVGQNSCVHGQSCCMRSIRYHGEDMLKNFYVISLIKTLSSLFLLADILEQLIQYV